MCCFVQFGTICTIFKNVKNAHGGVLFVVKLQASKSRTPPWVFFTFLNFTNGTKSCKA